MVALYDGAVANAGSGGLTFSVDVYDDGGTTHTMAVGALAYGPVGGPYVPVNIGTGLPINVDLLHGSAISVNSGTKDAGTQRVVIATDQPVLTNKLLVTSDLPAGASTAAKQPALGTAGSASADVLTIQGIAGMTKILVTPDSVALPANQSVNCSQMNGVAVSMGSGVSGTGVQRVVLATDQPALSNKLLVTPDLPAGAATAAKQPALGTAGSASADVLTIQGASGMTKVQVDGSSTTQPVSAASLPLPSGASTAAKQPALGTAGSASADVLSIQGIAGMTKILVTPDSVALPANQSVNLSQIAGATTATGHGTASGALRVELPTDGTGLVLAAQSGTWTVQPGNTANTTPWLTTLNPTTSGGPLTSRIKSAATTNATSVKGSAGQAYGWYLYNNTGTAKFFKFYNKASAPTVGTDTPLFTVGIPANGGSVHEFSLGIPFGTGIAYAITGATTDADTTATAADDVHGVLLYK